MGGLTKQSNSWCVAASELPMLPKPHWAAHTFAAVIIGLSVAHASKQFIWPS